MSAKPTKDALLETLANARLGPPPTEEEERAVAEARASLARGERTYSQEEIEAMIDEMRRQQGG
jgi:hypothetical protein